MNALAIFDNRPQTDSTRWSLVANTKRIPKAAFVDLEQADELLRQAEAIWQAAATEAESLRQREADAGRQEGWNRAVAETAGTLAKAQQQAQRFADQSEQRVLQLAAELVRKILPRLSRQEVLDELLTQSLNAMKAGRYIQVRVHPDHQAFVEDRLMNHVGAYGRIESLTVIADASMDPYDCQVESELGRLEAGFHQQLAAVLNQATLAAKTAAQKP